MKAGCPDWTPPDLPGKPGADPQRRTTQELLTCEGHTIAAGSTAIDIARAMGDGEAVQVMRMGR